MERNIYINVFYILDQKYKNLEIIFYDNFSSDNSKNIISKFKDIRIRYFLVIRNYLL